jgi:hypothetical protein
MLFTDRMRATLAVTLDLVMLGLILVNLALIIFDWMFLNPAFQNVLHAYVPTFFAFYAETIHENFFYIDLAFVTVFLVEIMVRWGIAIWRHTYHRWFFYPFIHWYDVLGCIPISSFRFLRVLRIFAVIPKVQRTGLVDLKTTYVYQSYLKYRDILVEEITDRVTVKILDGIQQGVRRGNPITERIVRDVIQPQQDALASAFAHRIQEAAATSYEPYRETFRAYVDERVQAAVNQNQEIGIIGQLPGVGRPIRSLLQGAISDITFHVVDDVLHDVAALDNDDLIAQITERSSDALIRGKYDARLNTILQDIIIDSLELIKEHVRIQQWKLEATQSMAKQTAPAHT